MPIASKIRTVLFLTGACCILVLLWLPGNGYPIASDTVVHALLGESIWRHGVYSFLGEPHAKYLPLHPFLSYPFVYFWGYHVGMHLVTLVDGFLILILTYAIGRRSFSAGIAVLAVLSMLFQPNFIYMSQQGSSDLPFAVLFLASVLTYLKAERDRRWYLATGILTGLACVTRYNGLPLFLLFPAYTLWYRRKDVRSPWFLWGMAAGAGIFGLWLLRNTLVFGSPLHTDYSAEYAEESPSASIQFFSNVLYYFNPVHTLLPISLPFAVVGLWKRRHSHAFLIFALLAVWAVSLVWSIRGIRYLMPGYPILLTFAVAGMADVWRLVPLRLRWLYTSALVTALVLFRGSMLCIYTYGACNEWFDRTVGILPKDMGLSSEGFHSFALARNYLNVHAQSGAWILVERESKLITWKEGVYRPDLRLTMERKDHCPIYRITSQPIVPGERVLYTTPMPVRSVLEQKCLAAGAGRSR